MRRLIAISTSIALLTAPVIAQQTTTPSTKPSPQLRRPTPITPALPAGAVIKMKLETGVSTAVNKVGDVFHGRVTEDVNYRGKTVIPVGSALQGTVTRVDEKRRWRGRPTLELRPEYVTLPNGDVYSIVAVLTDVDPETGTHVDGEGRVKGSGIDTRDKVEMAAGAGSGGLIGGLSAQSGKGALIGAMLGGGAAVGYWLSKRKSASIEAGAEIVMELSRPMAMNVVGD
jgi:hypothetical protein